MQAEIFVDGEKMEAAPKVEQTETLVAHAYSVKAAKNETITLIKFGGYTVDRNHSKEKLCAAANGVLDKAADLLDEKDKKDFKEFIKINNSYNQGNMFICKSKKIIKDYYKTLFEWLLRCEEIFGFDLQGYGQTRIYAFLGERFLAYWFNKYTKPLEWPIRFYDLRSEKK